ncbi:MAG: UDP-N-acetylglucosamine 2-epimerase (non-hydrolyzing) [Arthrobacter sp.]
MPLIMPIYGTRPEAIKMAPIVAELRRSDAMDCFVAVTGQHRSMLDQVNRLFDIIPDHDLNIFEPGQSLNGILSRTIDGLDKLFSVNRPEAVLVQGDTTTSTAAAMAAFYHRIPVVHVEAGLRSGDPFSPFPEEGNRKITSQLASLHLAPTAASRENLLRENVPAEDIVITGNTVIDALFMTVEKQVPFTDPRLEELAERDSRILLVTTHRRENLGEAMRGMGRALARIADAEPDLQIVLPLHMNPAVRAAVVPAIQDKPNVMLLEPLDYGEFCRLLAMSHIVLTDSGGVQEEAPSLGVPVLVMRENTERPEAVEAGVAKLIGTDEERLVAEVLELLHDKGLYETMSEAMNPYGDGTAARQIVAKIITHFF